MSGKGEKYVRGLSVGRLATVDAAGMPHCVPVCYAYDPAGRVLVMTAPAARKARNIVATGKAALVMDDGQAVRGVLARGPARIIDDQAGFAAAQQLMLDAGALARPRAYGEQVIIEVTVQEWVEWGLDS